MRLQRKNSSRPILKAGAQVSEHRLRNGLRVLLAERHSDPVVSSVLYYAVGARNETEREAGVSHFLEHMMFKGTRRFGKGEVDRITTELGGQNNAYTSYDHTAYWFELASDRWERALDIEADRMRRLLLDPTEFDAERAVVLDELAMGEDDPWRVLSRHVEAALFPRHPYSRPIIGYPDALRALTPEDMRDYYRRFYHPGNATLVIAGDIKPTAALRAVRQRFGDLPAGMPFEEADCFRPTLEDFPGPVRLETRWDDEARRLIMGWRTTPVGTDTDYALDLALVCLTGGRMARLQRRLVYDGDLATSVSASNDTRVDSGAFWMFVECAQGVDPAELERVVEQELARMAKEKVSAAELEELGEWAVDLDWRLAFDGGVGHERITAEMLRATVARYLSPESRVTGWCLPREAEALAPARSSRPRTRSGARKRAAKK